MAERHGRQPTGSPRHRLRTERAEDRRTAARPRRSASARSDRREAPDRPAPSPLAVCDPPAQDPPVPGGADPRRSRPHGTSPSSQTTTSFPMASSLRVGLLCARTRGARAQGGGVRLPAPEGAARRATSRAIRSRGSSAQASAPRGPLMPGSRYRIAFHPPRAGAREATAIHLGGRSTCDPQSWQVCDMGTAKACENLSDDR